MVKSVFMSAAMTGAFCALFAVIINAAASMLERDQIVLLSFLSGFLGSLVAQAIMAFFWKRRRK